MRRTLSGDTTQAVMKFGIGFGLYTLLIIQSWGQAALMANMGELQTDANQGKLSLETAITYAYSSTLDERSSADFNDENSLSSAFTLLGLPFFPTLSLSGSRPITSDETEVKSELDSVALTITHRVFKLGKSAMVMMNHNLIAPTDEESQKDTTLRTVLSERISVPIRLNMFTTLIPAFIGVKYWHRFNTRGTGDSNNSYAAQFRLISIFQVMDRLNLSVFAFAKDRWTYEGNRKQPTYGQGLGINYILNPNIWLNAQASTESLMYESDGTTLDVETFNRDNGQISLGFTVII